MRTGNYLTQERMLKVIDAATRIIDCQNRLSQEIEIFLSNGENLVSLDTIRDILHRNAASFMDISAIAEERGHFMSRRATNIRMRENMRNMRAGHKEQAINFEEERSSEFAEEVSSNSNEVNSETVHLSTEQLKDIENLQGLHESLRREHGAGFVWQDQICRTLNIVVANIGPVIDALEKHKFLQRSGLQNRYLILDV